MSDFRKTLSDLRRPRLLMRAARHGLAAARHRRGAGDAHPDHLLPHLIETEARLEADRRRGDASYSVIRHIEALVALLGAAAGLTAAPGP